jgi:hypothetical protein
MVNAYRWSPTNPAASDLAAIASRREVRGDVASVAQMWVAAAYDDLRRAGPDRGIRVRGVLDRYMIPWFGPERLIPRRAVCVVVAFIAGAKALAGAPPV